MVSRPDNPDPMAGQTPAPAPDPEGPEPEPTADDLEAEELEADLGEESLEEARGESDTGAAYNAHGLGVRTGLTLVPTWILSSFLASHANSLCRGSQIGGFGADAGLTRQEGCNWYVGGEYVYRKSQSLDIVASFGYQSMKTPNGYWLDADEWGDGCEEHDPSAGCDLGAADYTEIDVSFLFVEADFIGRATVWKTPNAQLQIGGGGGFGVGILIGKGVFQTPLGNRCDDATLDSVMNDCGADPFFRPGSPDPNSGDGRLVETCTRLSDLGDFDKCTPVYFDDPDVDQDGDGRVDADGNQVDPWNLGGSLPDTAGNPSSSFNGQGQFASCDDEGCSIGDLDEFGSRFEQADVPPVVPVVNLLLSMRLIVKDTLGINLTGGFNTGFYFGGSIQYFFGQGGKDKPKEAEESETEPATVEGEEEGISFRANNYTPYSTF
jgi:hypothetical protein